MKLAPGCQDTHLVGHAGTAMRFYWNAGLLRLAGLLLKPSFDAIHCLVKVVMMIGIAQPQVTFARGTEGGTR